MLENAAKLIKKGKIVVFPTETVYGIGANGLDEKAVKKLFIWAFMLRVDMERLGYDSINKYAIGSTGSIYSNCIPMFFRITQARLHNEIRNIQINTDIDQNKIEKLKDEWKNLYNILKEGV